MEGFWGFISSNIVFVVIIVAALLNFLNRGRKTEEEQERQRPVNPTANQNNRSDQRKAQVEQPVKRVKQTIKTVQESVSKSMEEQRQEQYDRLKRQYESSSQYDEPKRDVKERKLQPEQEEVVQVNIKLEDKLSSKGLIESVIMAEVLGPPRALNPYQNIVMKRKQR